MDKEEYIVKPKRKYTRKNPLPNKIKTVQTVRNKIVKRSGLIDSKNQVMQYINEFRTQKGTLNNLSEEEMYMILNIANEHYRNSEPIISDDEYDIIEDKMREKYPDNVILKQIGAPVKGKKAILPYEMWSMDKIKPDSNVLESWLKKYVGPYVVSCKLDGVSGMHVQKDGKTKLYTRGDGTEGQDISHLISVLKLPRIEEGTAVRGEFIIPKAVFIAKYKGQFANPRNLVSGIINSKKIDVKANDVHFVAYEIIHPAMPPSEQMNTLRDKGFETVQNQKVYSISNDSLSDILVHWRGTYLYEIDGIIISDDRVHERISGNPKHAFAFKMTFSGDSAECLVVDVIWNVSKDGYLKPRVQIEPIHLSGVSIEFVTGYNAKFIQDNNIGIGATVKIIRSGDVIPKIVGIVHPANAAKMPNVAFRWNDTNVDILLEEAEGNEDQLARVFGGFFAGIGVEGLGPGNVKKIINAGYKTIPQILKMEESDFLRVDGFKEKTSKKLVENIKKSIRDASLPSLMSSSNIFGRGFSDTRMELIMKSLPDILTSTESDEIKYNRVAEIKGFSTSLGKTFVSGIPKFLEFAHECGIEYKVQIIVRPVSPLLDTHHPLYGKTVIFTGFRNAEMEKKLVSIGARIGSTLPKKNNGQVVLFAKGAAEDNSSKVVLARGLNIPVYFIDEINVLLE